MAVASGFAGDVNCVMGGGSSPELAVLVSLLRIAKKKAI